MPKFQCSGCKRHNFKNEKALAMHLYHHKECKVIHYKFQSQQQMLLLLKKQFFVEDNAVYKPSVTIAKLPGVLEQSELEYDNDMPVNEDDNNDLNEAAIVPMPNNVQQMTRPNTFSFTTADKVGTNLLKIMFAINAPDYAYAELMKWAQDAYGAGYKFDTKGANYDSQMKKLQKDSNFEAMRPTTKTVLLPNDNLKLKVVCFNFTSMLYSLFNDTDLNTFDNLVVDPVDHFAKYESPTGRLNEVNSGHWYQQAYDTMVTDPDKDFLAPIIFAMDKTTISSTAHLHVFAVMFTTTLFNVKTRNQAHAWRPLGYIPIERNHYSKDQWAAMSGKLKSERANMLFKTVLESFVHAQRPNALDDIELTLGKQTKIVNLKVPLAFIIGDIQGGDGIVGRPCYYGNDARRICRMCDASYKVYESRAVNNCNLLEMDNIIQMYRNMETDKLHDLMQYNTWQAFWDIDYGGSPGGVFTAACPPEALHSLENGLILHCLNELFDNVLPTAVSRRFDAVVQQWLFYPKQKHMKNHMADFPRLLFPDGVSSIRDISAGTKVGILFAIVIASLTYEGRKVLLSHRDITDD